MEKLKILLVDDEADFLATMSMIIRGWGYGVIEAASGKAAIDILTSEKPDTPNIIILDYMMPEMDGIAALQQIRKVNKKIPVIMFTAHPDQKAMKGADELGVSVFVPKLSVFSDSQAALKEAIRMAETQLNKS